MSAKQAGVTAEMLALARSTSGNVLLLRRCIVPHLRWG